MTTRSEQIETEIKRLWKVSHPTRDLSSATANERNEYWLMASDVLGRMDLMPEPNPKEITMRWVEGSGWHAVLSKEVVEALLKQVKANPVEELGEPLPGDVVWMIDEESGKAQRYVRVSEDGWVPA